MLFNFWQPISFGRFCVPATSIQCIFFYYFTSCTEYVAMNKKCSSNIIHVHEFPLAIFAYCILHTLTDNRMVYVYLHKNVFRWKVCHRCYSMLQGILCHGPCYATDHFILRTILYDGLFNAPSYVTGMLHRKPLHTRNTRSSSYTTPLLNRPAHSKATLGDCSFSFSSSSVWNSIPNDVRCAPSLSSFKSRLKTYLFRSVYKDWTVSLITVHMCMVWPCYGFVDGLS